MAVTRKYAIRDRLVRRGYPDRWYSTAEMARAFGFPERAIQRRVQLGELVPTYRTEGGMPRWRRADFATQTLPEAWRPTPEPTEMADGMKAWPGHPQVIAQPGRAIAVRLTGSLAQLLLEPEQARRLLAILPAAIETAEAHVPDCTCRELLRDGVVEMVVPVPSCPVHHGVTP